MFYLSDHTTAAIDVAAIDAATAKAYARITTDDEDTLVTILIKGVQEQAEAYASALLTIRSATTHYDCPHRASGIGQAFGTRNGSPTVDGWAGAGDFAVSLPVGPVTGITSVSVFDAEGAETTVSSSNYYLSGRSVVFTATLPVTPREHKALKIVYTAGYSTLPSAVALGLLRLFATAYDYRDDAEGALANGEGTTGFAFLDAVREVAL